MEGLTPEVEGACLSSVQGMRCQCGMSDPVGRGGAGQKSEAASALDSTVVTLSGGGDSAMATSGQSMKGSGQ